MNIIEKIEIKHFRSFDGGKDQTKVKIDNLKDLNVFSGANDSGKSNVLRALNLFFNDEISPGVPFNKTRDFSKIVSNRFDKEIDRRRRADKRRVLKAKKAGKIEQLRDIRRADEVVSIKLFFHNKSKQRGLPVRFWVSKQFSQKNNFEGEYVYQTNLKGNAQVTQFLKSFRFEYVPAIKDREYFNHLFEKLQNYLFEKEDKRKENKFALSSQEFNKTLRHETVELFEQFKNSSGVDASFHIPSTLVDFFRTLSVQTENEISLFDRGDGVQARFIPEILDEISKGTKINIIWGFEEPENSYEAKNIKKIRDDFLSKYSREKQIFITSHTKEFLSVQRNFTSEEKEILNNDKLNTKAKQEVAFNELSNKNASSDISIYRVWRNEQTNYSSLITRFSETNKEWEQTCDDLGIVEESRIVESLQDRLEEQAKLISESTLALDQQLLVHQEMGKELTIALSKLSSTQQTIEEYEKPILVVEDKYDAIYKIAYLKTTGTPATFDSFEEKFKEISPFAIQRSEGAGALAGRLRMNNTDGYENKKLVGLFDFDKEGAENFYLLKKGNNWDNNIEGDISSGFYKKRGQHPCFYALLLPIPDRHQNLVSDIRNGVFVSYVEIENLLSDDVLNHNGLVSKEGILNQSYLKMVDTKKQSLQKVLIELEEDEFIDFVPLFRTINELFDL